MREKELEDYICDHPECMPGPFEVFGRQVRTPHGIVDILGFDDMSINVIELKAGPLREADIGQVLRYTYDVRNTLKQIGRYNYQPIPKGYRGQFFEMFCISKNSPMVLPVLLGKSANRKVLAATEGAGIICMGWKATQDTIEIDYLYDVCPAEIAYPGLDTSWVQKIASAAYHNFIASLTYRPGIDKEKPPALAEEDLTWLKTL